MSDIIHLLPDSVANQIAAGEVIQRPASIIKELVENALDAGATRIQVVVEDAGKSLVQVIDNGSGMSATDARLAFERHATSKIKQATDLFALQTMGFRGEALASIAAVAQVELRTRKADEELGTSIQIEGSKVVAQEATACPVGANFAVRNLFFNIPARRKFLKSNQTELTNILSEFERIALAHPNIAFSLHSGGNLMMDLPCGNFRQRIVNIFGRRIDSQIVPIQIETTLAHIKGFVGQPSSSRKKNAHQYLFVNGRYMRHPYFAKAIQMAYERLIPEGQQIPFFVCFEVDPARIDVNIHPTKTEIKFEDDNAIFQILLAATREALGKYGAVPTLDFDVEGRPDIPTFTEGGSDAPPINPPCIHINDTFNPFEQSPVPQTTATATAPSASVGLSNTFPSTHSTKDTMGWKELYDDIKDQSSQEDFSNSQLEPWEMPVHHEEEQEEATLYTHLENKEQNTWQQSGTQDFIQYNGRYIITPLHSGLGIIDQHRAHIRILYERYMKQLENHQAPSQRLLFPEMLTVSPSEAVALEGIIPQLQEVGFDLSPLGNGSYSILATPLEAEGISPVLLVTSLLHDAMTGESNAQETIAHIIASALAKKIAMPIGQALNAEEMAQFIEQLFTCKIPNLTPDGKPTLTILNPEKLV